MLHYPEVMKKAQAELDSVVGPARLPGFDDYEMLPYIQAVVRETLRWIYDIHVLWFLVQSADSFVLKQMETDRTCWSSS